MNDSPITFTVYGQPRPKGSRRYVGNGITVESDPKQKDWAYDITLACRDAMDGRLPLDGPVHVIATFYLNRPKSTPKKILRPFRKPDTDKLVRSLFDAMTAGGVFTDDARVSDLWAAKRFAGDPGGLPIPGVVVEVQPL